MPGIGGGDRGSTPTRGEKSNYNVQTAPEDVRRRGRYGVAIPEVTRARSSPRAKSSFLQGDEWAYIAGIVAILLGSALVFFMFPKRDAETRMLAEYATVDSGEAPRTPPKAPKP